MAGRLPTDLKSAQLHMAAAELAEMAAQLAAIAVKMNDNNVESIGVTHHKTFKTGIKYCGSFCSAANAGWLDAAMRLTS